MWGRMHPTCAKPWSHCRARSIAVDPPKNSPVKPQATCSARLGPRDNQQAIDQPRPSATQHSRQPHGMERSCTYDERQPASHTLQLRTAESGTGQWAPSRNARPRTMALTSRYIGDWPRRRSRFAACSTRHGRHMEMNARHLCISLDGRPMS